MLFFKPFYCLVHLLAGYRQKGLFQGQFHVGIRQGFLGLAQLRSESDRLGYFISFFHANHLSIPATAKLPHPPQHRAATSDAILSLHRKGAALAVFHFPHQLHFKGMTISNYSHDTWNLSFQSTNLFQDGTLPTINRQPSTIRRLGLGTVADELSTLNKLIMARDEAYRKAEQKIEEARRSGAKELNLNWQWNEKGEGKLSELPESLGQLTQLQSLNLSRNQLTALPDWLGQLKQLQSLNLSGNQLTALPEWLGQLTQLQTLNLYYNQLTMLPESLGRLKHLRSLWLTGNRLRTFPDCILAVTSIRHLELDGNELTTVPESIGRLVNLEMLWLSGVGGPNKLQDLPASLGKLANLSRLELANNPLNPELAAAYKEGLDAVKRYLRAKAEAQVLLNEAKLILIGEGEVGKSCLLGALRGDPWEEGRPTTHGIEIKPVKVTDPATGTEITLNGWDFGGQRVYRPTHQLFFSAPAVYLVVWKPREGPQQGFVKEWIKLVKHREPDAKILVVATHGGPKERQPDIDRQEIWDLFGKETVLDFFFVESRPPTYDEKTKTWVGERAGIKELKDTIARVAVSLPEVGRSVPKRWENVRNDLRFLLSVDAVYAILGSLVNDEKEARNRLKQAGETNLPLERVLEALHGLILDEEKAREELLKARPAYLPLERVLAICRGRQMDEEEAKDYIRVAHRLGHLIHYAHDPALRDIVILKPDWLSTAMSYVLDDKQTRDNHGLVEFSRLGELWNDPARPAESRYDASLHPLFLRLMERFDLSYKVAVPAEPVDALGFWQRVGQSLGSAKKPPAELHYTSLVAQLVPDLRPSEPELAAVWPANLPDGDGQQVQICRIVETKNGHSATAEGLFYQLIVRLHKYSLGRLNYKQSVHWQRGLVLDDDYNGRALLEHIGNDVRITVRAAYPEAFLAVLTHEVKYLVESFWAGLRCDVMVPCVEPCGRSAPGTGLYEVQKLIESKRRRRPEYPCPVCNEWQNIDCLLRNAPAARPAPLEELLGEFVTVRAELAGARQQLIALRGEAMGRFDKLDIGTQRILSRVDDAFKGLMQALTDEAKEGPRLFSFEPVDPGFFDRPKWVSEKFRVTL